MSSGTRRYSDAEMRRILARAAATEAGTGSSAEGHTLAEIRDVAREACMDPAVVDRAAAALEKPAATHVFLGFPLTFQKEVVLAQGLSREQMLAIARQAEHTVGGSGSVSEGDGWLQWHHEHKRTFIGMVRSAAGTRVRVISDHARAFTVGVGTIVVAGSFLTLNVLFNAGSGGDLLIAAGLATGTYAGVRLYWYQRCRGAIARIQQILEAAHTQPGTETARDAAASPVMTEQEQEKP